ncbi:MAG: hypothetical protein EXS05_07950 [Planctomycetaceae bacterium]|nr:hypothetical protein [Planctomycetaceae bacterium]
MAYQDRTIPALSIFGAFGVLVVWQIVLASVSHSFARTYRWESFFRPTHYVQAMLHTSMFTYLGLYWEGVPRYAPLILTQIIFGYLCDMLIAWSRGRVWRAGFGVVPIVLSTNLFLWFREPVYYLQLALMVLTFLGKEFVTWNYGGRARHIFNPSAFSLSIASVLLLATGTVDWTHAVDIAIAFDAPPNFFEVIFLLGLVVQSLFIVTPVTFGAALALCLFYVVTPAILGERLSPTPIQSAVFLGMTFLVTDPATSPRSHFGRFLFGLSYGTGVMVSFILLRLAHEPAIFDKLLIVPVVNLMVPLIDRLCDGIARLRNRESQIGPSPPTHLARFGWLTAYIILFGAMLPHMKAPQSRPSGLLPPPAGRVSEGIRTMILGMLICRQEYPEAYRPFGFRAEIADSSAIRKIYHQGPDFSRGPAGQMPMRSP